MTIASIESRLLRGLLKLVFGLAGRHWPPVDTRDDGSSASRVRPPPLPDVAPVPERSRNIPRARHTGWKWQKFADGDQYDAMLSYVDVDGVVTDRRIRVVATGRKKIRSGETRHYVRGFDYEDGVSKAFIRDRILRLDRI